jgi:hypothetical protein
VQTDLANWNVASLLQTDLSYVLYCSFPFMWSVLNTGENNDTSVQTVGAHCTFNVGKYHHDTYATGGFPAWDAVLRIRVGARRAKMTHKNRKKLLNFIF